MYWDENRSRQDGWKKIFRMLFGTSLKNKFKIFRLWFLRVSRTSTYASVQRVTSTQGSLLLRPQNPSVQHVSSKPIRQFHKSITSTRHFNTQKKRQVSVELTDLCGNDGFWRLNRSCLCVEVMCMEVRGTLFYLFNFPLWWIHKTITDATIEIETEIIEIIKKREISGSCSVSGVLFIKFLKYKFKNSKFESHQILFI